MEGYIHEVTVFPDLTAVIALPEMISLVNQLLDVTTADVPFIFFYDTTFKLGDFYVSPLVFRNETPEQLWCTHLLHLTLPRFASHPTIFWNTSGLPQ
jgi:hypothetical protein